MYTIDELTEKSGVSKRTIYYYVKLGLLPSVGTRGPLTRYEDYYLDRLTLIKILQANHLPLDEIGDLFSKLSNRQIAKLAASSEEEMRLFLANDDPRKLMKSSKEVMAPDDARDYIQRVLELSKTTSGARPRAPMPRQRSHPDPTTSSWERIRLADGVELHIDNAITGALKEKIRQLVRYARTLFNK